MSFGGLLVGWRSGVLRQAQARGAAGATRAAATACGCRPRRPPTTDTVVEGENKLEQCLSPEVRALHTEAMGAGKETYTDPSTGFTVFTRLFHLRRGNCCGSQCRHCPYGHVRVPSMSMSTTARAAEKASGAAGEAGATAAAHSMVYTKGGDKGTSALYTGERRKKTDVVFEALGAVDELSSHAGVARALLREIAAKEKGEIALIDLLEDIQQELLNVGTVIATPLANIDKESGSNGKLVELVEGYKFPEKTLKMEAVIDEMDSKLAPLRVFILPGGGNTASAQLHVCRTTCRRAERRMVEVREVYGEQYTDHLRQATVYVNRLSDFMFVAARSVAEEDIVRRYD